MLVKSLHSLPDQDLCLQDVCGAVHVLAKELFHKGESYMLLLLLLLLLLLFLLFVIICCCLFAVVIFVSNARNCSRVVGIFTQPTFL